MEIARWRAGLAFCFHTTKNEIPIKRYSTVQTGLNIQLGGLNAGLFKDEYQLGIDCDVTIPAMAPKASGSAMAIINLAIFDLVMMYVNFSNF